MCIPTWRLVLTGGAITILAVAGIGFAAAATAPAQGAAANVTTADQTADPAGVGTPDALGAPTRPGGDLRDDRPGARFLRIGRHLVHVEATITGRDGQLVHLQLDHGTVQSIGGGSLVIAEVGGGTESVTVDDKTIVYLGREDGDLGDVKVGAEVFVQSRVDGGTVLAKRILVVPPAAT